MSFLDTYAYIALAVFLFGAALKLGRFALFLIRGSRPRGRTSKALDAPRRVSGLKALKQVLFSPLTSFHLRANRSWARGYIAYHIAIATIVLGYALSMLILLPKLLAGSPVPSVVGGGEAHNYSPSNILAIVFGNAEQLQADFLFGSLAPAFIGITWVAVLLGLYGIVAVLVNLARGRSGAVTGDIDPATRGLRREGSFSKQHLFIVLLVLAIIVSEILARLELVPGIVFLHVFLGLSFLAVLPYTYLFHIFYGFIALYYAAKRRESRTVA